MRLTEVSYGSARAIEGYGPGFFRVSGHVLRGACLITPWDAGPWGGLGSMCCWWAWGPRSRTRPQRSARRWKRPGSGSR